MPTPVPDPVRVSAASVDGDNDIRMDSDSNSGDKVSEVCGADGVCTEGDEDRMDHAHTDQKDRTRTSGDTVKKEDASTGSSNRNNFSAELLEGIKPLTHMDRVVRSVAERFRGRYRHFIHFDLPLFPPLPSVVCVLCSFLLTLYVRLQLAPISCFCLPISSSFYPFLLLLG